MCFFFAVFSVGNAGSPRQQVFNRIYLHIYFYSLSVPIKSKHHYIYTMMLCYTPMWYLKAALEDTEHYLLHCPQFCTLCQTLLGQISDVGFDIANMSTKDISCLLLYGKLNGSSYINRMILKATLSFIKSSKGLRNYSGVTTARPFSLRLHLVCSFYLAHAEGHGSF